MTTRFFDVIDWTRPWLAPLLPAAQPIVQAADWRSALNSAAAAAALHNHRGLPIRFVPQSDLPADTAYEAFISATGCVPTRENLHDFLNALAWLTYPKIKTQLNALQAAEIARPGAAPIGIQRQGAVRGKLRDAATIFDENSALLVARSAEIVDALRQHRWHDVFVAQRAVFGRDWEVWLFGHALMEKLVAPYKAITAHAWPLVVDESVLRLPDHARRLHLDATVGRQLAGGLQTSDFTPLPVLGVPGWWSDQDAAFYGDAAVFRRKKSP
ncbi:MAG: hypothetical protein V7642_1612 [Burkholderiales bacterium]|jgi:hypothetical protein